MFFENALNIPITSPRAEEDQTHLRDLISPVLVNQTHFDFSIDLFSKLVCPLEVDQTVAKLRMFERLGRKENFSLACAQHSALFLYLVSLAGADQTDFERLYISPWVMSDHMMLTHMEGLDSLQHACDPIFDSKSKAK